MKTTTKGDTEAGFHVEAAIAELLDAHANLTEAAHEANGSAYLPLFEARARLGSLIRDLQPIAHHCGVWDPDALDRRVAGEVEP